MYKGLKIKPPFFERGMVTNGKDVYNVIKAGDDATRTTSGIMKAENPEKMMEEMIRAVRTAWDEIHN